MRLGVLLRYQDFATGPRMDLVEEAERLGFHSAWTSEAYGSDAVTPAAWVLARTKRIKVGTGIMQIAARTPACAAMTAMTLQALSGDRFLLGVGPSGPQVIEGWHGVPYGKPLARTREYVKIIRQIFAREDVVTHDGEHYQIPYMGPGSTGLGKPLKSIMKPPRMVPVYTGAIAPAGLRLAGEIADGVIPIYMSPEKTGLIVDHVLEGMRIAGRGRSLESFDIAPFVRVVLGDDLARCRDALRPDLALYIGGMGARDKNFYNDYAKRLGYADAARKIQDAYLAGRREEAAAAVPDALIDEISLIGTADRIKGRIADWKAAGKGGRIGSMLLGVKDAAALRVVAEAVL